jgi:hypothetical protein
MTNRIAHLINAIKARQDKDLDADSGIMAHQDGQVTRCSFCNGSMCDGRSDFNALSEDAQTGICSVCIEKFAKMAKLGKLRKLGTSSAWKDLSHKMLAATLGIKATEEDRGHAIGIALRLAKRSYQIMSGARAEPLRLRLQSDDPEAFADMVAAAATEAGIMSTTCDDKECLAGDHLCRLLSACGSDRAMLEHAVMLVRGNSIPRAGTFSVVCVRQ